MIGWPEFVDQIAEFYRDVDDGGRSTVVLTGNDGEAGAIDHYGADRRLPPAYSGHNSYADVRIPPGGQGPVLVVGYGDPRGLLSGCAPLGSISMPHQVDNEEQGMPRLALRRAVAPVDRAVARRAPHQLTDLRPSTGGRGGTQT